MERATIYNAKLLNILNVSQKDDKKAYKIGDAFTDLPEEKRQHVTMSIEHEEDVMLGSFADTLVACTAHLTADLEEDAIYKLIGSNYLPLQKAGFYMLNQFYEIQIPRVLHQKDLNKELEELKMLAIEVAKNQDDEEEKKEDNADD